MYPVRDCTISRCIRQPVSAPDASSMRHASSENDYDTESAITRIRRSPWEVDSLTEPRKVYNVSKRKDESFACSCPRWKFATAPKADCKHIQALRFEASLEASPIPTMPVANRTFSTTEFVNVYFGTSFVARLSTVEAARLRANLQAAKTPEPVITAEFSIRRKFRFDEAV
jgi:hypothetical protein